MTNSASGKRSGAFGPCVVGLHYYTKVDDRTMDFTIMAVYDKQ